MALKANTCADFAPKPSGKIEKFTTILCGFAGFVPERKKGPYRASFISCLSFFSQFLQISSGFSFLTSFQ